MNQILNMIIRMVTNMLVRKGVGAAMGAGTKAWQNRKSRKVAAQRESELEQDPAITGRRKLKDDERKGDEVLYPTDELTDDMQPRR